MPAGTRSYEAGLAHHGIRSGAVGRPEKEHLNGQKTGRPDVTLVGAHPGTGRPLYRFESEPKPASLRPSYKPCSQRVLLREEIYVQLIGSCQSERDKFLQYAHKAWCGRNGLRCSLYLDNECKASIRRRHGPNAFDLVSPSEYFTPPQRTRSCCDPSVNFPLGPHQQPSALHTWDGLGPSSFYCSNYRNRTLPHQSRFLQALAHGRQEQMARFQSGELKWLLQVDDDSSVNARRLIHLLGRYDERQRLQLGDFSPMHYSRGDRWRRPYACGGSGTIFSTGAVLATDFRACASRFSSSCLQSDWAIGLCAGYHQVLPVTQYGCHCGGYVNDDRHIPMVVDMLRSGKSEACTFMHVSHGANRMFVSQQSNWSQALLLLLASKNAIVHSSPASKWTKLHASTKGSESGVRLSSGGSVRFRVQRTARGTCR